MTKKKITLALAGNANVGKSVIFNYLTGLHQHIGNWPGKTVEKKEGTLHFQGHEIDVLDLPGIYSLTTFSLEEVISRDFIAKEKPDVVINIIDATALERNLIFMLQLLELEAPLIVVLNQMDLAEKKGIRIDTEKLGKILGAPIVKTVAITGEGIPKILKEAIKIIQNKTKLKAFLPRYKRVVEEKIAALLPELEVLNLDYPDRFSAIKLLENDPEIKKLVSKKKPGVLEKVKDFSEEIQEICGEKTPLNIKATRCKIAHEIAQKVQQITAPRKPGLTERINRLAIHKFWGYPILILAVLIIFSAIFKFGNFLSGYLEGFFEWGTSFYAETFGASPVASIILGGLEGVLAGITIALPYIIPFYIVFGLLESSGYLSRIAFLVDNMMHKMGLHGKAFIPMILGYGCSVPAIMSCRIMETQRERLICGFTTSLIPCAARTVIILGLVGKFVGLSWALSLYVFNLIAIFLLGQSAFRLLPGEPMGLIMEMHDLKWPHFKTVFKQAWLRLKGFVYFAFPIIIIGSVLIKILEVFGWLEPLSVFLSPVTISWLGLPAATAIVLVFGILRKELALIMLATLLGTANFALVLNPVQMIVFALVTMFYIPCIATIAVLVKEFGWKKAGAIMIFEIFFAVLLGGIAFRILELFML